MIYDADLDKAILRFEKPLHEYGTGAFRLRVGSEYKKIETYALAASVEVLSGRLAQSGYQTVIAGPGSETVDGTRLGMSDGQLDVALEMDLRAVVLTVPGIVSTLPDGTILQLDDGTNVIRFEIDNPYAPGRVPGFADAAAVPITITGNSPAEAAEAIAAAIASTGFTALVDPTAAGRLLVVDALEAVTSTPQLAVSTPGFALLEPADLSSLVDGEWFEVDGLRYELDIAGDGANGSDTDVLVPITTLTRGSVAAAIAAQLQLHGESALASDTRVFLLSAASLTAAVPEMTVNDAVFSIQPPAVTSNVEDGEWLEINTGSRVRRFEFDRDGAWDGNAVRVDISSLNITVALKSAVDAEFAAEISRGEITTLVSGNRLILVGVAHVQRGGVDPDMNVVNGFAIDVPHGLGAGNDGEYLELIDASAPKSVVRFEFDSNGVVGTDAVLVPISGTGTINAQRLRNEMDTRGYATVLSGAGLRAGHRRRRPGRCRGLAPGHRATRQRQQPGRWRRRVPRRHDGGGNRRGDRRGDEQRDRRGGFVPFRRQFRRECDRQREGRCRRQLPHGQRPAAFRQPAGRPQRDRLGGDRSAAAAPGVAGGGRRAGPSRSGQPPGHPHRRPLHDALRARTGPTESRSTTTTSATSTATTSSARRC